MDPARAQELLARERGRLEGELAGLEPDVQDDEDTIEPADAGTDLLDAGIDEALAQASRGAHRGGASRRATRRRHVRILDRQRAGIPDFGSPGGDPLGGTHRRGAGALRRQLSSLHTAEGAQFGAHAVATRR